MKKQLERQQKIVNQFNNFITFEGPEGSGKTTIVKLINDYLIKTGRETVVTREPGGTGVAFSEDIRKLIMNSSNIHIMTELLLFEASRKEHIDKVIKPSTENGKIVICDRYMDSSTVYQGIVQGLGKEKVKQLNEITVGKWVPGITFILDVCPEIGLKRISDNDREINRFDSKGLKFHNEIRQAYLEIAKEEERFILIDASKSIEETFEQVKTEMEKRI